MKKIILLAILLMFPVISLSQTKKESKTYFKLRSMQALKISNIQKQTLDYSCGAAALVIILHNYFGDTQFNETALLKDIILRLDEDGIESRVKDGFTMLDIKHMAQRLGYIADGVKLKIEHIYALKGPVIILLHKNNIKHFVVLKGAKSGKAYIADPISGSNRISEQELLGQWKGEALIIGREHFGTPQNHTLSIKHESPNIEKDSARVLQTIPTMRKFSN